jgi:hypothetical protein
MAVKRHDPCCTCPLARRHPRLIGQEDQEFDIAAFYPDDLRRVVVERVENFSGQFVSQ